MRAVFVALEMVYIRLSIWNALAKPRNFWIIKRYNFPDRYLLMTLG
jgi:hypothetical protein